MKNILKLLGVLVTKFKNNEFTRARIILTFYYTLSIVFILLFINTSVYFLFQESFNPQSENLKEIILKFEGDQDSDKYFLSDTKIQEEAVELLLKTMLLVDTFILILTIFFSYFLTKKILSPVEKFSIEQKKFVSNITHDLRTPLAVMKVGTEIFINGEYTNREYKEFISEQLDEINHLIKISEDLLFLLKSQEKIKRFKKINLSILLVKEVKKMKIFSEQKKIKISSSIENGIEFFGEETEIKRIILNLLKNATDYNKADGNIFVNLFIEKNKINLEISDDGIGVSKKDQKYIFDRFYKADSSRGIKKNNSGLGLSIVKEIVLNHKGTIKLESELKKGTKIKIIFPY